MTDSTSIGLRAGDGHEIRLQAWQPSEPAAHAIQILHGLGEHADRYARFAGAAVQRGYAVYCHDHRGHGANADQRGYFANADGWSLLAADAQTVHQEIAQRHEGLPITLLGHSMGSYIAQSFVIQHTPQLAGMLLSGSTWPSRALLLPGIALAKLEGFRRGAHQQSALLNRLGFANFNKPFHPARTEFDWLSRDDAEVDRYIADPLCGGPHTIGLWQDLLGGLLEISSDSALQRIAADLPILISGGDADPIGGDKGMTKLLMHYAQTGHQRIRIKLYAGGRHEMLNETNRDEVTADWLDWIQTTNRSGR